MIRPEQIPQEMVLALHDALMEESGTFVPACDCRTAIAAALAAWPGVHMIGDIGVHLPLPPEGGEG